MPEIARKNFHLLAKPVGPICNLDCKYCFYLEKENLYPQNKSWAMPEAVLEKYIREYIAAQDSEFVSFAWQGGEPTLLGVKYFRRVVELQKKYAGGKQIENALQTNGVMLNDEWGEFLKTNDFLVGLSIDGTRELHDLYRVDKSGKSSFDRVVRGIEILKKHLVEFNTLTVVHRQNAKYPLEIYRFLKEIGSGFMQFIPIAERVSAQPNPDGLVLISPNDETRAQVSEWSVLPEDYGDFLCAIFDEWVRRDVGKIFVQMFDVALENWLGMPASLCVFRETCGEALAIEHNGDVYSCDHFVYPENKLGNIIDEPLLSLVASPQQAKFGLDKSDALPEYCRRCEVRFACHGECPKHRFTNTPDGEAGLNYLCAGYRKFFNHIAPQMEFMAEQLRFQQPPANVMAWTRARDAQMAIANQGKRRAGRNDACVCGSNLKFKKCCGRLN